MHAQMFYTQHLFKHAQLPLQHARLPDFPKTTCSYIYIITTGMYDITSCVDLLWVLWSTLYPNQAATIHTSRAIYLLTTQHTHAHKSYMQ